MKKITGFLFLAILLIITACQDNQPALETQESIADAYTVSTDEVGYPVTEFEQPTQQGYPIEDEWPSEYPKGPEFSIDTPVVGGDLVVTGKGPSEVPIRLISVSEIGILLGETVITTDGTFTINLQEPLNANHTIGLQIGDLAGTEFSESDFLYSPTYYERPLVGILVDMVVVE
jgi:hypothetical protein